MSGANTVNFDRPDETRTFPNGRWDIVQVGETTIARATFEPGWRWSNDVKPLVGTDSCHQRHVGYMVSGRLGISTDDGTEIMCEPGQAYVIEPGHDGWVEGNEPVVVLEFATRSAETYAKQT